jgi:uncharacterized protein YjbI with pentapeptide repeats
MARLRAEDVLRRYAAGERDFRGADLTGLRFHRVCLAGADFSGADLRGTDFLEADLQGAKFIEATCGLSPRSDLLIKCVYILMLAVTSLITMAGISSVLALLFSRRGFYVLWGNHGVITMCSIYLIIAIAFALEGFRLKAIVPAVACISVCTLAQFLSLIDYKFVVGIGVSIGFISAILFAGAVAWGLAIMDMLWRSSTSGSIFIYGIGILHAFFYCIINSIGAHYAVTQSLNLGITTKNAADYIIGISTIASACCTLLIAGIALYRMNQGAIGYKSIRNCGMVVGCLGGTRFSGSDLRSAVFQNALLERSNFDSTRHHITILDRVAWQDARGLDMANFENTTLKDPRIQKLLVTLKAPGFDLRGLSLHGAYLSEADLRDADLREVNLCDAVLEEAHLERANLKGSQCLGTNFEGAHFTGAALEAWSTNHTTNLRDVDCAYVYLLEPLDAKGKRRDDHHRERLPHDPDKTFGPGDFEAYFKQVIEEVKLLIKNGVDPKAFQAAFQELMRLHPQITPESLTGIKRMGNDVLATLQVPAEVDKGEIERDFFAGYNALTLRFAEQKGLLEGERRVNEVQSNFNAQLSELMGRLIPPTQPTTPPPPIQMNPTFNFSGNQTNATHTRDMSNTTLHAGDGNLINTGTLETGGGMVNLGDLSDQASIAINALPDQRLAAEELTLRELLHQLQASLDDDTEVSEGTRADALSEIHTIATAAQDPQQNASLARRAVNTLKGISASVAEANKALEESSKFVATVKKVLPCIAAFFMG